MDTLTTIDDLVSVLEGLSISEVNPRASQNLWRNTTSNAVSEFGASSTTISLRTKLHRYKRRCSKTYELKHQFQEQPQTADNITYVPNHPAIWQQPLSRKEAVTSGHVDVEFPLVSSTRVETWPWVEAAFQHTCRKVVSSNWNFHAIERTWHGEVFKPVDHLLDVRHAAPHRTMKAVDDCRSPLTIKLKERCCHAVQSVRKDHLNFHSTNLGPPALSASTTHRAKDDRKDNHTLSRDDTTGCCRAVCSSTSDNCDDIARAFSKLFITKPIADCSITVPLTSTGGLRKKRATATQTTALIQCGHIIQSSIVAGSQSLISKGTPSLLTNQQCLATTDRAHFLTKNIVAKQAASTELATGKSSIEPQSIPILGILSKGHCYTPTTTSATCSIGTKTFLIINLCAPLVDHCLSNDTNRKDSTRQSLHQQLAFISIRRTVNHGTKELPSWHWKTDLFAPSLLSRLPFISWEKTQNMLDQSAPIHVRRCQVPVLPNFKYRRKSPL